MGPKITDTSIIIIIYGVFTVSWRTTDVGCSWLAVKDLKRWNSLMRFALVITIHLSTLDHFGSLVPMVQTTCVANPPVVVHDRSPHLLKNVENNEILGLPVGRFVGRQFMFHPNLRSFELFIHYPWSTSNEAL